MARVIRDVMTEYGATGPGFSINDPEVDHMSRAYAAARSAYFVIEDDGGAVIGGAGVAPLAGADPATCELRKMYLLPAARGRGLGRQLLTLCLDTARRSDFRECYLETLASMSEAARLYERAGFRRIDSPRGATGHCGCDRWYVLPL
ncbi:MAG: GNAT family N-acetyltransferase [Steroidobacteraceae bacterium]